MIVSYSASPSVNQRGTRFRLSWMWKTCASSCVVICAQLKGPARGESAVTTWPKQTPCTPMFGRPLVRTLKCWLSENISTCTGVVGVKP